jgi:hypothetical protein
MPVRELLAPRAVLDEGSRSGIEPMPLVTVPYSEIPRYFKTKIITIITFFTELCLVSKFCPSVLEIVGLGVSARYVREFD